MKKDKKWAQKEVDRYLSYEGVNEARNALAFAKGVINQLDEPEVLSQGWISEKSIDTHVDTVNGEIQVTFILDDLKELLVPKQELPVIPKFVADYINRKRKRGNGLDGAFTYIKAYGWDDESSYDYEVYKWLDIGSNDETFARAWLDGYEVEKDQKYILSINITDKASKTNYETFLNKRGIFHSMDNESFNSEEFNWSEEEIKDLESGEVLFEHFAVKVEELEE